MPTTDWPGTYSLRLTASDFTMPQAHVREVAQTLPDGRLETLDTGHEVPETQPAAFVALVIDFLAG